VHLLDDAPVRARRQGRCCRLQAIS